MIRQPRPLAPLAVPVDVKLMNTVSCVLGWVAGLLLVTLGLGWGMRQPRFNMTAIQVVGEVTHNSAVTLRAYVAPQVAGNFFTLDLTRTRAAFESVPWVRRAKVQREFPNRLKVVLQEHQAVAYWGADDDARLLNSFGEVFEANLGDVDGLALPTLKGPADQAARVLAMYQRLAPHLQTLGSTVDEFQLSNQGSWRTQLENGAVIELGQGSMDEIEARLRRFLETWAQVAARYGRNDGGAVESADLRYSNGYALKLQGVTTLNVTPDNKDNKKR